MLDNIVGGFIKGGFGKWPALADQMLAEQLTRLKTLPRNRFAGSRNQIGEGESS